MVYTLRVDPEIFQVAEVVAASADALVYSKRYKGSLHMRRMRVCCCGDAIPL